MNTIVAQCGGPTPVINATLAAIIEGWQSMEDGGSPQRAGEPPGIFGQLPASPGQLLGSRYGFEGLVKADWVELSGLDGPARAALAQQPAAALGGSRFRPGDADFAQMAANLHAADVGAVFLIGGNGTMAGAQRLADEAQRRRRTLQVIGVPKTIDNDLAGCHVTPGFGSAARYIAHTTQEIGLDLRSMRGFDQVAVVEVMGRHVGWLAAAAALARHEAGEPPHLILLPEEPVASSEVLQRIAAVVAQEQICTVVVAEGVRERDGTYWAELVDGAAYDASGQRVFSMSAGASAYLVREVQGRLGLRCRQIKLNTAQRSTRLLASPVDWELARMAGTAAVAAWASGASGVLPVLVQREGAWGTELRELQTVIGRERRLPPEYIDGPNYDVTEACRQYIAPLLGELPPRPLLWID
jgi:6-phosphofructokinase 1